MYKKYAVILGAVLLLVLCFIWGNSALSPAVSGKISAAVGELMAEILGTGDESTTVGGLPVRKLGHFFEYAVLGIVVPLFLACIVRIMSLRITLTTTVGFAVPLIDETIQIFSGRGPALRDVWIDIAGYAVGCALIHIALLIAWSVILKSKKQQ